MTAKIEWYREVLELEPNSKVFFPLARLLDEDGQTEEAMDLLRKGVERHPEYLEARLFLIELLYKNDRREECNAQVGLLSKMFASYAGFWQAWAACLASEQGQADTASIIRFLAAHFVSGPLNLHEVLNRGLDSILGTHQAAQVWNMPARAHNSDIAKQMTAAAEFAANSEEMLQDLDAELGNAEMSGMGGPAETPIAAQVAAAAPEMPPAESVEPELASGDADLVADMLPVDETEDASVPSEAELTSETPMAVVPPSAPELELCLAAPDSEALPVTEPESVLEPVVEVAPEPALKPGPEIALEAEAAPVSVSVEPELAAEDGDPMAEVLPEPAAAVAPGVTADARPAAASAPEPELGVAESGVDALPVEEPVAEMETAATPQTAVESVAEAAPEIVPEEVSVSETVLTDAELMTEMLPGGEPQASAPDGERPVAGPDSASELPDVGLPGVPPGAADPVAEMLLAQDAGGAHGTAMPEPELAIGDLDPGSDMLAVEEPAAEPAPTPESVVIEPELAAEPPQDTENVPAATAEAAPEAEVAIEFGPAGEALSEDMPADPASEAVAQPEAFTEPQASAPTAQAVVQPAAAPVLHDAAQPEPETAQSTLSRPKTAATSENSLFHPAAFMTAPAVAPNPDVASAAQPAAAPKPAAQPAPAVKSPAEKAIQAEATMLAAMDLPEIDQEAKTPPQDDFSEEEPFSLRTRSMAEVLAEQGDIQGALDIYQELAAAATSADEVEDINRRIATLSGRLKVANASAAFKMEEEEAAARSKAKLLGMLEALEEGMRARAQA